MGFDFLKRFDLVSRVSRGEHYNMVLMIGQPVSEDLEPVSVSVAYLPHIGRLDLEVSL